MMFGIAKTGQARFVYTHVIWDVCVVRDEITRVPFLHEVEVSDVANKLSLHHARHMLSRKACQSVTSSLTIRAALTCARQRCSSPDFSSCRDQAFFLHITKAVVEIAVQSLNLDEEPPIYNQLFSSANAKEIVSVVELFFQAAVSHLLKIDGVSVLPMLTCT